jgi:hypothetical protein
VAARTENTITVAAPFDLLWQMSNDVANWPSLFSEYESVQILERRGDLTRFRLTMHPDSEGRRWSWVSERTVDEANRLVRARRVEPGAFEFMNIEWRYFDVPGGVEMQWRQDFQMRPDAPVGDEEMRDRINRNSTEQLARIKRIVEDVAQAATGAAAPPDHAKQPPEAQLFMLLASKWLAQAVYVTARLGIADALADGPRTVEDLAGTTGCHAPSLLRILRATAIVNVFTQLKDGRFALTPQSQCLRSDAPGSLHWFALFSGDPAIWTPYGDILETVRTGQPAFPRVHGRPVYDYLGDHPDLSGVFDRAMNALTDASAQVYLDSHDFGRYKTIADIGGGQGVMLARILQRHQDARGILLDLPHVVAQTPAVLADLGVSDRIECVAGSFFDDVPPDADAYLLKTVLHNWDDDRAGVILRRIREAIGDRLDARVLVLEDVLEPGNAWNLGKAIDIDMLVTTGGRGRTRQEWVDLFDAASFDVSIPQHGTGWTVLVGQPR